VDWTIHLGRIEENEIVAIVDKESKTLGAGYGVIYHVFLPPGVDTCMSGTSDCYSPDNQSTFQFCAYHSSADLPDGRHVIYTVESSQTVDGCKSTE
jgi:hypothetical protein